MASRSLFARAQVKVNIPHDVVFLHPLPADSTLAAPTQDDPELRGCAVVSLPRAQKLKEVKVVMKGLCTVQGGNEWPYVSYDTLHKELIIKPGGELFDPGDHKFAFTFTIPSDSPESQRCCQIVKAFVSSDSLLNSTVSSQSVEVLVSTDSTARDEIPEPLEIYAEDFCDDLGLIRITISSPHFTVASLLYSSISFDDPPYPITITSIQTSVLETFRIEYEDGRVAQPPERRHPFLPIGTPTLSPPSPPNATSTPDTTSPTSPTGSSSVADSPSASPLIRLVPGTESSYGHVLRVPDSDRIRPSTLRDTQSRLRASHALAVSVKYVPLGGGADQKERTWTFRQPVQIPSCCFRPDYHLLPTYSTANPETAIKPITLGTCACSLSVQDLLDRDGPSLSRAREVDWQGGGSGGWGPARDLVTDGARGGEDGLAEERRWQTKSVAYDTSSAL